MLVPGCGTGYEVRLFAELGHEVLAIDFSDAAIAAARRELGALADRVRKADFFAFATPPFGVLQGRLRELLEQDFEMIQDAAVPAAQSIAVFKGGERWQVWERRL